MYNTEWLERLFCRVGEVCGVYELSVAVCVSAVCVALHHCVSVELRDSHDV